MSPSALAGRLFDGRTTAAVSVTVEIAAGEVRVARADGALGLAVPLPDVRVTEGFGTAPRQLVFPDGTVVEVAEGAALAAALAGAGRRVGIAERLQRGWPQALGALVVAAALLAAGYRLGLPAVARATAALLPARLERQLGAGVLELLDDQFLTPSTLPGDRRDEVEHRLRAAAAAGAPGVQFELAFRGARYPPGVNAFALPGGTVVLLDELVRRTDADERLLAVVGHELGHVALRHPTKRVVEAGGLGAAATLIWGDASSTAASFSAVLALLGYSRDAEREADASSMAFVRAAGAGERAVFDAFCLLADVDREARGAGFPGLLSTHPGIDERLAMARGTHDGWTCPPRATPAPVCAPNTGAEQPKPEPDGDPRRQAP